MTIEEHILANDVLREVNESLTSPFLKGVLEIQTAKGIAKYPNTVNVNDYSVVGWIEHSIQELMDSLIYTKLTIKRIKQDYYRTEPKIVHVNAILVLQSNYKYTIQKLLQLEVLREQYLSLEESN